MPMSADELKLKIASNTAALLVGNDVSDQEELNEWSKIFGSLLEAFKSPGWVAAAPALANASEEYKTQLAADAASLMTVDKVPSQAELTEYSKVVGSLLKAFSTPEFIAKVPAFAATTGATPTPGGPTVPPPQA